MACACVRVIKRNARREITTSAWPGTASRASNVAVPGKAGQRKREGGADDDDMIPHSGLSQLDNAESTEANPCGAMLGQ